MLLCEIGYPGSIAVRDHYFDRPRYLCARGTSGAFFPSGSAWQVWTIESDPRSARSPTSCLSNERMYPTDARRTLLRDCVLVRVFLKGAIGLTLPMGKRYLPPRWHLSLVSLSHLFAQFKQLLAKSGSGDIILLSKRSHPLFDKIVITSDFMLVPVFCVDRKRQQPFLTQFPS
jgi:hypothetical protein